MSVFSRFATLGALVLTFAAPSQTRAAEPDAAQLEFFETRIRPVLVEQCYQCHSADAEKANKLKAGLALDTAAGFLKGGESGPVVVPGKAAESLLIVALRHEDLKMPPKNKLPDAVIADFETWVNKGAAFPAAEAVKPAAKAIDWAAARTFWAFQAPTRHARPAVKDAAWPRQELDYFILAELERRELRPVAPADKRTWLRRVTFDVVGLPPTPEELAAYLADETPEADARVVDRLLASPHYGERWGRYWLDVARYAEDKALAIAKPSPHAFRYRDWVVQALNRDLPYDQFLRLQIAGDQLPEPITDYFERLAGLGFQGLGAEYHKGNFAAQVMADELDDRVDTLTRGLLGLTVACARCHDHKYDPIPTRDYYSLAAAYQGASLNDLAIAPPEVVERHAAWDRELKSQEAGLAQWLQERGRDLGRAALPDVGKYLTAAYRIRVLKKHNVAHDAAAIATAEQVRPTMLTRLLQFWESGQAAKLPEFAGLQTTAEAALNASAAPADAHVVIPDDVRKAIDEFQTSVRASLAEQDRLEQEYQAALAAAEPKDKGQVKKGALDAKHEALLKALWLDGGKPFFVDPKETVELLAEADRATHATKVAALDAHRKAAPPAPDKIHGVSGGGQAMKVHHRGRVDNLGEDAPPGFLQILPRPDSPETPRLTRLDLANAIASPANPLTARVFVNRVWQHHFGRGIVGTPSNFGLLGDRPTHPELLDDLAVRFMESGWSIKTLHRTLLLSATYRLSSVNDPANAARDPENVALWRMTPRRLDFEAWRDALLAVAGRLDAQVGGPSIELDHGDNRRRTIYATVSRSVLNATLNTFDFPDANVSSDRRSVTTVPQQQLFALNSAFMVECAKAFARRLETAAPNPADRIPLAIESAYGRPATEAEKQLAAAFLQAAAEQPPDQLTPWEQFAQALLAANEFIWVD